MLWTEYSRLIKRIRTLTATEKVIDMVKGGPTLREEQRFL